MCEKKVKNKSVNFFRDSNGVDQYKASSISFSTHIIEMLTW